MCTHCVLCVYLRCVRECERREIRFIRENPHFARGPPDPGPPHCTHAQRPAQSPLRMRALAARPRGRGSSVWHGVVGASCGHRGRTRALFSAMFGLENIWMAIALKHADTHGHNVASRGVCAGGSEERLAADGDELDVEFEGGAGRDVGRRAALAVCRAAQRHTVRFGVARRGPDGLSAWRYSPRRCGSGSAGCMAGRFWFDLLARTCEVRRAGQRGLLALAHLEHALRRGPVDVSTREGRCRPCGQRLEWCRQRM